MPTARWGLAAASAPCPTGQTGTCVYAVGGNGNGGTTVESYNRLTNAWSTLRSLTTPRRDLAVAAAPCPLGQTGTCVYAVGGFDAGNTIVGTVESYNPTTNAWSTVTSLTTPRSQLAAAAAPCPPGQTGTCVYAVGGNNNGLAVGTVESYNPATNAWSTVASNTPRLLLAAAAAPCPSGQTGTCVYAVGGFDAGNTIVGTAESYNPTTNAWSPVASLPTRRAGLPAAAAPCPSGQTGTCVYAVGGFTPGTVGTVESYNPVSNVWTTLPTAPTPRAQLAAATTTCPPGQTGTCVYTVGGVIPGGAPVGTLEALDPPAAKPSR
ncbi:Kelch repeat-containing protein [Streptomyces sp. R35]|uniref:Kelch repeat-containing protein n=1 Tax=Streptomyces sp. R35 TaxID=3238630 RepID=A0AB39S608_9ACTN